MAYFAQNIDDTIAYSADFTDWTTGGATVSSVSWDVTPTGPTISGESLVGSVSEAKLAGVSFGVVYRFRAEATLSTGEAVSETIAIRGVD